MREPAETGAIPVLILTGMGVDETRTAKALVADEFLAKPAWPTAVMGIVQDPLAPLPRGNLITH